MKLDIYVLLTQNKTINNQKSSMDSSGYTFGVTLGIDLP